MCHHDHDMLRPSSEYLLSCSHDSDIYLADLLLQLDPQKRAAYDQHGSDPESRFSGMSSAGHGPPGFSGSSFGGSGFETEMSPEDLFNMFFGGGMGGGSFGGGSFGGGPGKCIFVVGLYFIRIDIMSSFHSDLRPRWVPHDADAHEYASGAAAARPVALGLPAAASSHHPLPLLLPQRAAVAL